MPTYAYIPTLGGSATPTIPYADRFSTGGGAPTFYSSTTQYATPNLLTANQMAATMGHVMALPHSEQPTSPIHREHMIFQRPVQNTTGLPAAYHAPHGLMSIQDLAGADIS